MFCAAIAVAAIGALIEILLRASTRRRNSSSCWRPCTDIDRSRRRPGSGDPKTCSGRARLASPDRSKSWAAAFRSMTSR